MENIFEGVEGFIDEGYFEKNLLKIAYDLAKIRISINKKNMGDMYYDPYYYRGEISSDVELLGILAELIARQYLKNKSIDYIASILINQRPVSKSDINCLGEQIDVKGVWSFTKELRINEKAHQKKKEVTFYWFILIDRNRHFFQNYFFKYDTVSNWELKECRFTPAYCKILNKSEILCTPKYIENWMV